MLASVHPGRLANRAATSLIANGNWPQASTIARAAHACAPVTSTPATRPNRPSASSGDITSSVQNAAPSRPTSRVRLVTRVRAVASPGSRSRTCWAVAALSSTSSTRRPAMRLRHAAARSSGSSGTSGSATPTARSKRASASGGAIGSAPGVWPRRSRKICPSGNSSRDRVRSVQRKHGLANPSHAVDGDDRFAAERGRQLSPFLAAPGEVGQVVGQRSRHDADRRRARRARPARAGRAARVALRQDRRPTHRRASGTAGLYTARASGVRPCRARATIRCAWRSSRHGRCASTSTSAVTTSSRSVRRTIDAELNGAPP